MEIRLAFPNEVCHHAGKMGCQKMFSKDAGSDQWQNGYPNADVIIGYHLSGHLHVALEEGELRLCCCDQESRGGHYEYIYGKLASWRESESSLSPRSCGSRYVQEKGCSKTLRGLINEGFLY